MKVRCGIYNNKIGLNFDLFGTFSSRKNVKGHSNTVE